MENLKKAFVELTDRALPEEDMTKFMRYLDEREVYRTGLMDSLLKLSGQEMESILVKESRVLEKLREERAKLLEEVDRLPVNRKTSEPHGPRVASPSMAVSGSST